MNHVTRMTVAPSRPALLRMLPIAACLVAASLAAAASAAKGNEPDCRAGAGGFPSSAGCAPLCCPDDYVPKPAPCVCPVTNNCPDTYCPKPCLVLPCPENRFCPDDYCRKPLPPLCRRPWNAWSKCIPLAPCDWLCPKKIFGKGR